jgi:thiaminase/transcriptional activator TenA
VDATAEGLGQSRQEVLRQHFTTASRYEWMFWDMAWRLEAWPL